MTEELDKARFEQETKDRDREIALKERELRLKEMEIKKSPWHDPVFVGLIAAILALLGNIYSSVSNARAAAKTSADNARLAADTSWRNAMQQLFIETMQRDPDKAEGILRILLTTKVIEDKDGLVANALASGLFKNPAAKPKSENAGSSQNNVSQPEETVIAQQEISIEHGGYAQTSDPLCAEFNNPALLRERWTNQQPGFVMPSPSVDKGPACAAIRITVPAGKTITKVAAEAREQGQSWTPCQTPDGPWKICNIGWSAWNFTQDGNSVIGIFKNWSHDRNREGRILVFGH